jgi:DNA-binding NtrC family response regulator
MWCGWWISSPLPRPSGRLLRHHAARDYLGTGLAEPNSQELRGFQASAPGVPMVLVTGFGKLTDVALSELGAADVILKPFDNDDLIGRLQTMLGDKGPLAASSER